MPSPYQFLKLNRFMKGHRVKCLAVLAADIATMRHLSMRIDPILGCNLRCQMCHYSNEEVRKKKKGVFSVDEYKRIAEVFFHKSIQVVLGCAAEPTLHPDLIELVAITKRHKVPNIGMATNGQKLNRRIIEELCDAGLTEMTISLHGVTKQTYERLQPPASYEKLHEQLQILTEISHKKSHHLSVRINFTVNPDNMNELKDFFNVFGDYSLDAFQVRPIMDLGETVYTQKDLTPYRERIGELCGFLGEECRKRGIIFLKPDTNNGFQKRNSAMVLLPLVFRRVSPEIVWQEGFDWKTETYERYCRKIKWRRQLIKMALTGMNSEQLTNSKLPSLGYDIT